MGERETALGSPPCGHRAHTHTHTHTHTVFPAPRNHLDVPFSLSRFSPLATEPQDPPPDHPGGAGSKTIGRKPITHKTSHFPVLPRVLRTPDAPHTYLYSLSPLAITIALYRCYTGLRLRLFDLPFSDSWCTNPWNPAPEFLEFTLFRFDELTLTR